MTFHKAPKPVNQDTKIPVDKNRVLFIDYLRGFVVAVMVMDHVVQGYATKFGRFWFLADTTKDPFFDVLHMISNAFIMPILFLLAGMFVIKSLTHRGLGSFLKERFLRLVVPFIIFMPLLTPIMAYPKFEKFTEPGIDYLSFAFHFFTSPLLQAGPYWFLGALMTLTLFAVLLHYLVPFVLTGVKGYTTWMTKHGYLGLLSVVLISGSLIGVSDLNWGAPWWTGWEKEFPLLTQIHPAVTTFFKLNHVQASRFLLLIYYFFMGIGFSMGGHLTGDQSFLKKLGDRWFPLLTATIITGALYIGYSLLWYDDGAYCHHSKGLMATLNYCDANLILLRTYMHGLFCALITLTLISGFYQFNNEPSDRWIALGKNAFGIYLIHEVIVVLMQNYFYDTSAPIVFKFLATWGLSFGLSWVIVDNFLRKAPGFRRIL